MDDLQWTTIEAGSDLAEPNQGWTASTARLRRASPGAASPVDPIRRLLRTIADDPVTAQDRRGWLARVRALLDRSQARLRAEFEADGTIEVYLRGRTRLADGAVTGLLHLARSVVRGDRAGAGLPVSILAVGGYGRRELGPASDLDLLFLLDDAATGEHAEGLIGFVIAGLWDLGFDVDHASRTVGGCLEVARRDHRSLTSLFDARFLAGPPTPHASRFSEVRRTALRAGPKALAALSPGAPACRRSTASEHDEPDVKHGSGGLRDIQRLQWLAGFDLARAAAGERDGPVEPLPQPLAAAQRFFWTIRCHLHLLAGRSQDRLTRDWQPLVARRLGLGGCSGSGAAELMDRYHAHANSVRTLLTT